MSTLKRTQENFPKMKVRGKRRKLERIAAMRYARFNLAMLMLGESFNGMGMAFSVASQVFEQFKEANKIDR